MSTESRTAWLKLMQQVLSRVLKIQRLLPIQKSQISTSPYPLLNFSISFCPFFFFFLQMFIPPSPTLHKYKTQDGKFSARICFDRWERPSGNKISNSIIRSPLFDGCLASGTPSPLMCLTVFGFITSESRNGMVLFPMVGT